MKVLCVALPKNPRCTHCGMPCEISIGSFYHVIETYQDGDREMFMLEETIHGYPSRLFATCDPDYSFSFEMDAALYEILHS